MHSRVIVSKSICHLKGMHLEQMHTTKTEKFHHENGGTFL